MKTNNITVTLTPLLGLVGHIDKHNSYEVDIVNRYKYSYMGGSLLGEVTNGILTDIMVESKNYNYGEIHAFFNPKKYLNLVTKFTTSLDYLIGKELHTCVFDEILYAKTITHTPTEWVVEFSVITW